MVPEGIETYEHDDLRLDIHYFDTKEATYWVQSGVGVIQFSEDQLLTLRDMINQHEEEALLSGIKAGGARWPLLRRLCTVAVLVLLFIALPALIFI